MEELKRFIVIQVVQAKWRFSILVLVLRLLLCLITANRFERSDGKVCKLRNSYMEREGRREGELRGRMTK